MKSEQPLILASTSTYRRALLERLGIEFRVERPEIDESAHPGEAPASLVKRLALAKARRIAANHPDSWVIGSDQIAVHGATVLGKPHVRERCIEQLTDASGQRVLFLTAVALVKSDAATAFEHTDSTWVRFRHLDAATIERYVDRERPFDCAGGFKCEGLGISLFDSIETLDPSALIGLPLIAVSRALRAAGFLVP